MRDVSSDTELLHRFALTRGSEVLSELARRYTNLVYSAARRQTRDGHLAEDVTQAVFILLSRRAHKISDGNQLIGWLYRTTRYTAANAMKLERRRRHHETNHAAQEPIMTSPAQDDQWSELAPRIDAAIGKLDKTGRTAVLLRYFQDKSVQEVAEATGVSVDAAQKRLSRAIHKLRSVLSGAGIVISAATLASLLSNRSVEAAPASLHLSTSAITLQSSQATSTLAREIAARTKSFQFMRQLQAVAAICAAIALCTLPFVILQSPTAPAGALPAANPPIGVLADSATAAVTTWNPALASFPIAKPWPLALPGTITGSPMPADLFGDGRNEIVVPCMQVDYSLRGRKNDVLAHPHPTLAAFVYAFFVDGTTVPGFPVQVISEQERRAAQKANPTYSEHWGSTPSLVKIGGKDVIVMPGPNFKTLEDRYDLIIRGDGSIQKMSVGGWRPDPWATIAVADIQENGSLDLLGGYAEVVDGAIRPSDFMTSFPAAFGACAGNAGGDGHTDFYWAGYAGNTVTGNGLIYGYDHQGHVLEGWPQPYGGQTGETAVMGDLLGDGKMEVVIADGKDHILAWTWDGQPFGNTFPQDPAEEKKLRAKSTNPDQPIPEKELCTSIFKDGVSSRGPVALADLDGDGKAEVIVVDDKTGTLRAWHGDGSGFGNPDGIIAKVNPVPYWGGISVATLGGDGSVDFFLGSSWIHRARDGKTTTTKMLPEDAPTRCQPTICDIDGDGLADVLVGTRDGRVFIYHTGKAYRPEWVQWATLGGNLNHTGCWHDPRKR